MSDRPEKEVPRDGDGALPSIGALLQASNWEDRVAEARARREKVLAQGGGAERPLRPAESPASTPARTPADSAPSEPAPPPRGAAVPLRVVEGGATEATPSAPEKRRDVTTQDDRPRWADTLGPMAPRDDPATFQSIRPAEFIPIPSWPSSVQSDAPRSERRRGLLVPLGVALAVGLGFGLGAWFASPGEEPAGRSAPEAAAPKDTAALREPVPPAPDAEPRAAAPREEATGSPAPSPDTAAGAASGAPIDAPRPAEITAPPPPTAPAAGREEVGLETAAAGPAELEARAPGGTDLPAATPAPTAPGAPAEGEDPSLGDGRDRTDASTLPRPRLPAAPRLDPPAVESPPILASVRAPSAPDGLAEAPADKALAPVAAIGAIASDKPAPPGRVADRAPPEPGPNRAPVAPVAAPTPTAAAAPTELGELTPLPPMADLRARIVARPPSAAARIDADPVDVAALPPPPPAAPDLSRYTVYLHAPTGSGEGSLREATASLDAAGYAVAEPIPVSFGVDTDHVRFYRRKDAEAARAIAEVLGGEARDFTSYRPRPAPGTIEVWLASR